MLTPCTKLPCNDLWALEYAYSHVLFFLFFFLSITFSWSRNRSPFKVCSTFFLLWWKRMAGSALCFHQDATASENRKSNTPPIFQVTSISHHCVSYSRIYSSSTQCEGKRYSHWGLMTSSRIPVEVSAGGLLICRRHEEAAWGESWSQPQIAPLGATPAATPVVHREASNVQVQGSILSGNKWMDAAAFRGGSLYTHLDIYGGLNCWGS